MLRKACAVVLTAFLISCSGGSDTDSSLSEFDSTEVSERRQELTDNGLDVDDADLAKFLWFDRDCRDFIEALEETSDADELVVVVEEVSERATAKGYPDHAEIYDGFISSLKLGDIGPLQDWSVEPTACEGVE